ncbi:Acyl-coenzyme A thioesterase PaaI [Corynebacterium faecale]|uniref:hydroxyphenylacetyl-CoA thioesterase PaaI n=1 Tax=Corynebacterium faecale TaxID=1758466 RepID=UPI0025B545FB|nr:hydroxyphenylacetyl-CoA thioesterase PaaI [Corynebacterium faecale]WJY91418.1 Acyl-coenzyme A thioesterase PaaI [Corynebacterium faecale]
MTQTVENVQVLAPGVAAGPEFEHVRAMYARDEASKGIGLTVTELSTEGARGHFTVRPEMCNGHGTAQGGILFTFADAIFAGVCNASGDTAVASQVGIHYISPARVGELVEAEAVNRQTWGRNGVTDVVLRVGDRVVAEFRGTSRVVKGV